MKTALTIAGSDCSGGAGIQADIKTMSALGVFGMSVIVSVVAENTSKVISVEDISPELIGDQLDAVFGDITVDAVKVGMLHSSKSIEAVASKLLQYGAEKIVIDPVMYAKDGNALMREDCIDLYIQKILPLAACLTPNIPEAERFTGMKIRTEADMKAAAERIVDMGAKTVLVKGGHFGGDPCDILFDGSKFNRYTAKRIVTKNTHGTGCTLSSAIASYLALGEPLKIAVKKAKQYITGAIKNSLEIGRGNGPLNHFYKARKINK